MTTNVCRSLSVDLSQELRSQQKSSNPNSLPSKSNSNYIPPTQKEMSDWARSTKFATRVVALDLDEESQKATMTDIEIYNKENTEILLWNASLIGVCFAATYMAYTQDIAASYLAGSFGGLIYLRLLKRGVEGIGGGGGLVSLAAQPRLLVPVALVMAFNRWNTLAADQVGVHLELLPMLVGFFTYKAAIIGRQTLSLFHDMLADVKAEPDR